MHEMLSKASNTIPRHEDLCRDRKHLELRLSISHLACSATLDSSRV